MPVYIVEPKTDPDTTGMRLSEAKPVLEESLRGMLGLIDEFNRAAGGDAIAVKNTIWLNSTIRIEASEENARNLAESTGLKVSPPRPLTRD
jgi:hypothetical protein